MSLTSETRDFGANEWFVHDMYQQFLNDPASVDSAWHEFFADYQPGDAASAPVATPPPTVTPLATSAPAAPIMVPETAPPPPNGAPAAKATSAPRPSTDSTTAAIKGVAAKVAQNMEASLHVPTATSVRAVPAKLLEDNRIVINRHLARARGGKVSFTHLIGYALVQAVKEMPAMNTSYAEVDGKPVLVTPNHVGLGLAIDLQKADGTRQLVVAAIRNADSMDFFTFWQAYEDIVRRARVGKLTADDFAGVTISLTNPGGIGTVHSVPRLMQGQGTIVGVGAMEYPAEYQGSSPETLANLAVSKVITLTSTYDHRIIQGAQSGEFLKAMHGLLLGEKGFYEQVFTSLHIPYVPVQWVHDIRASHEGDLDKTTRVHELIHAYRVRGHLMADTDPLEFKIRSHPDLDVVNHGLTLWDLDREFPVNGFSGQRVMKLRDVLGVLRDSYCRTVGLEYMHIQDPEQRRWLQERVEKKAERPDPAMQLHVLARLNAAEAFETFLQTKYVGQKRFSLEGGEAVIPLLDEILAAASRTGLDEVCIGMPHRGRLNVLANIVGKSYGQIFREFEGNIDPTTVQGSGDVKYHLGAFGTYVADKGTTTEGKPVGVYLACNPSHLEAVNPVLEGIVRAKQDLIDKGERGFTVLPVLMHGDAAFAGQGIVAETLNLSLLKGYRTGGTIHVIVNNQVGFTTSPQFSRSSVYCTDVARMIQAPIFHVNGDDPEACVRVARLAFEYRQAFHSDVVIDMVCYRRRGHNEADEPSFTQPLMYDTIDAKRSTRKLYTEALIGRGDITVEQAEVALKEYQGTLERAFTETREAMNAPAPDVPTGAPRTPSEELEDHLAQLDTAIPVEVVKQIGDSQVSLPEGFTIHPKLAPQMERRATMASQGGIDWAFAETLAFGSLLVEGRTIRLAGQDTRRGTFGQRHASLVDRVTGNDWLPLQHLSEGQGQFFVYDSLLSEFAALGFEYGYAVARPEALVLWEAQFGDFVNGAQSITDEFISSSEQKWNQRSSVVLLLPHGYEGQGPDHSSARIERFLQLCAEDNMTVAAPSTPANYAHLLRAHAMSDIKRPLIVFTPKSMLRLKAAASAVEDVTTGHFQPVVPDPAPPATARRILLVSGKFYYDLAAAREKQGRQDISIVRVEQLYPVPTRQIAAELAKHPQAEVVWAQEEPGNQGGWTHMREHLTPDITGGRELLRVSRKPSASPSVGSHKLHEVEQAALVTEALA